MKLSVVIPTYQRRELLARTLASVFNQDFDCGEYEVIVVVDGSSDGTAELLRAMRQPACPLRIVEQPNRGLAAARNAGLKAARGDLVLFLDDDLSCCPGLLDAHVRAHRQEGSSVVWGVILPDAERADLAADLEAERLMLLASTVKSDGGSPWPHVACGANDSALRTLLNDAGGYDERFRTFEEVDLGIRLWKRGIRTRCAPDAIVYHAYDKTTEYLVKRHSPEFGRDEVLLCRTHPEYLPFSRLAGMFRTGFLRRVAMQLVARLPLSPEPLLRFPCAMAEKMRRIPFMRRVGVRLLAVRMTTVELRAAIAQVGSWQAFRREFDC